MSNHLANISHRQVTGRWMDRGFLLVLLVLVALGMSSVAMAIDAAAPIVRVASR
jgi:hypothetical protein